MEIGELRQRPKEELKKLLQESRDKMRQMKFDLSSGKIKNVRGIRQIRKEIAVMLTVINESRD